jgi:predicted nucleic acid-binding Zn finger protein
MSDYSYKLDCLIGKKIKRVELSPGGSSIEFYMDDGKVYSFYVEGDCCSSSWIEHLTVPDDIEDAVVLSWDDFTMDSFEEDYSYVQCYENRVHTPKGDVVLEYRNSSNGYYGGYIVYGGERDYE